MSRHMMVFFHGTGRYQGPSDELISWLASNQRGIENVDYVVVDGPGSGNRDIASRWVPSEAHNAVLGAINGNGVTQDIKHVIAVINGMHGFGSLEAMPNKARLSYQLAMRTLDERRQLGEDLAISTVTVCGFSRGGIQALMLAHELAKDKYSHIQTINIICIDPVKGPTWHDHRMERLPGKVRRGLIIYAQDEVSSGFEPYCPRCKNCDAIYGERNCQSCAEWKILSLPGRHSTCVELVDTPLERPVISVIRSKVLEFLLELNVFNIDVRNMILGDIALLEHYQTMSTNLAEYEKMRKIRFTPTDSMAGGIPIFDQRPCSRRVRYVLVPGQRSSFALFGFFNTIVSYHINTTTLQELTRDCPNVSGPYINKEHETLALLPGRRNSNPNPHTT